MNSFDAVDRALAQFREHMRWLQVRLAADPDGQLTELAQVLQAKRGCRRRAGVR